MTTSQEKTLTVALMDPPYESEASTTALRIIDAALRKGISVNVFAYEGAVNLTMKGQAAHPNPVKGTSAEEQDHPTTARFISGLFGMSGEAAKLDWAVCGLCADERGAGDWIEGPRRGSPGDFYKFTQESVNTLIIGAR
jgi:tRNA 2-thiouridine synthesizing protein D